MQASRSTSVARGPDRRQRRCLRRWLPVRRLLREETVPGGYHAEGDTTKTVTVDNAATCDDVPYVGEDVSFVNVPLTDVTVSIDSQVPGGTDSTVECVAALPDPDLDTDDATGDGSITYSDLEPQTLLCTVVIDP